MIDPTKYAHTVAITIETVHAVESQPTVLRHDGCRALADAAVLSTLRDAGLLLQLDDLLAGEKRFWADQQQLQQATQAMALQLARSHAAAATAVDDSAAAPAASAGAGASGPALLWNFSTAPVSDARAETGLVAAVLMDFKPQLVRLFDYYCDVSVR